MKGKAEGPCLNPPTEAKVILLLRCLIIFVQNSFVKNYFMQYANMSRFSIPIGGVPNG